MKPAFDAISAYGIGGIALLMTGLCVHVYARGNAALRLKLGVAAAAILGGSAAAAASGLLARFDLFPPPMACMIAFLVVLSFAIGLSPLGAGVAREVPLAILAALQIFRFPLELVMHHAAEQGIMLPELSYSGYNFDIITGLGAVAVTGALYFKIRGARALAWCWNIWGMYCLAAILVIAVSGSPMVMAFGSDPRHVNTWVLYFPYVWLPVALVTIAISGHIIIARKLLSPNGGLKQDKL